MNQWEKEFGRQRRAKDHRLIAEVERQIEAEEKAAKTAALSPRHNAVSSLVDNDAHAAIARALGGRSGEQIGYEH